jgi:hypothetical protein
MERVRKTLILLMVAGMPAAAPPFFAASSGHCFTSGTVAYRLSPEALTPDYRVRIDNGAPQPDVHIGLLDRVELADFALRRRRCAGRCLPDGSSQDGTDAPHLARADTCAPLRVSSARCSPSMPFGAGFARRCPKSASQTARLAARRSSHFICSPSIHQIALSEQPDRRWRNGLRSRISVAIVPLHALPTD